MSSTREIVLTMPLDLTTEYNTQIEANIIINKHTIDFVVLDSPLTALIVSFADAPTLLQLSRVSSQFRVEASREVIWKVTHDDITIDLD